MASHKITGGGGSSSNGLYQVSGTIGQHEAGNSLAGPGYSLTGGFWRLISAVPNPAGPTLTITSAGGSVIISWPNNGSFTLQMANLLATPINWTISGYPVSTSNGTNTVTITPPTGSLFFRLGYPQALSGLSSELLKSTNSDNFRGAYDPIGTLSPNGKRGA